MWTFVNMGSVADRGRAGFAPWSRPGCRVLREQWRGDRRRGYVCLRSSIAARGARQGLLREHQLHSDCWSEALGGSCPTCRSRRLPSRSLWPRLSRSLQALGGIVEDRRRCAEQRLGLRPFGFVPVRTPTWTMRTSARGSSCTRPSAAGRAPPAARRRVPQGVCTQTSERPRPAPRRTRKAPFFGRVQQKMCSLSCCLLRFVGSWHVCDDLLDVCHSLCLCPGHPGTLGATGEGLGLPDPPSEQLEKVRVP